MLAPDKKTILVVDDEKVLVDVLLMVMEEQGYNVITRTTAHHLQDDIPAINPDLILLDIRLFDGDGLAVTRFLKSEDKTSHIPVVLMSACVKPLQGEELCGAEVFLAKPFDILELVATVHYLLGRENE